jgi:exosome complex exonuclease RRP6
MILSPPCRTHPYRFELTNLQYPSHMFEHAVPEPPKSFEDTPFTWVATPEDLNSMLEDLRQVQEIAIDLEHHDYRTYGGFVCLMQVSTRHKDWIVDTLVLRDELEDLNEVFTDPRIVKVSSPHPPGCVRS